MADRRTELLRATCRAIAEHGVRGLRVEEVAAKAGVSTGLIYYYFRNRAGLLTSALEYVSARAESYAHAAAGKTGRDRLRRQLVGEFQNDAEVRENSAIWGEVRGASIFNPELRPSMAEATRRWVDDIAELVDEGQTDGSIGRDVVPRDVAVRMTSLVEGLSDRWLAGVVSTRVARAHVAEALERELGRAVPTSGADGSRPVDTRSPARL